MFVCLFLLNSEHFLYFVPEVCQLQLLLVHIIVKPDLAVISVKQSTVIKD